MTKDLNHVLFWGTKWPANWVSGANIQHISQSRQNSHVNQDWCETSGKFWQNYRNFYLFWGPKWPIFSTHLKVLAMSMWSGTEVKPVKTLRKWPKTWFWLILEPKMVPKVGSEAHITHTTESTCNDHVKQYWCETSENFLRKWPKSRILTYWK